MYKNRILSCLSSALGLNNQALIEFDSTAPLSRLGMTSLSFVSLIVNLEEEFQIEIPDEDLLLRNFSTIDKICDSIKKQLQKKKLPSKKVLILDADDVLWKGVVGEESIHFDQDVLCFHNLLVKLYNYGILLCICSKNNVDEIENALLQSSILKRNHFLLIYGNSNTKVANIESIATELNLSFDSFVFIDNSDYELGFVSANFPMITCIRVDYQNMQFLNQLNNLFSISTSALTSNRTELYRAQKEREKEKRDSLSIEEYNNSLQTELFCERASSKDCLRLSELSIRTNQFNLSDKHYSKNALQKIMNNPAFIVLSLSAKDKYGDMGIVGMALIQKNVIEAFILSCRVLHRNFEQHLLINIKSIVSGELYGIYSATEKNKPYSDFYTQNGVIKLNELSNEIR